MDAPLTPEAMTTANPNIERISWLKSFPFFLAHFAALGVFFFPFQWKWVVLLLATYYFRMFFVTAGYHRYFAHRTYQTSRVFQFLLAFFAEMSAQKGVLWWASHHRHHHKESDQEDDIHSPTLRGFWWSHVGWILCEKYDEPRKELIRDFYKYPEIVFINKHYWIPPLVGLIGLYAFGGWAAILWGGLLSTVVLWHGTFTINSLSHVFGKRRYLTTDTSKNNFLLALITCGEGWHNNHHYHQNTANQGWFWWELDFSYYTLKLLSALGLVWKLRLPSDATKNAHLAYTDAQREQLGQPNRVILGLAAPAPAALIKRS
jgi:stearoyl-CoA desaturase (delta-9 desaturase)